MSKERNKASEHGTVLDTRTQAQRFIEAARELGADEDEATFKAKLAVIARQKPKDELEPSKDKKG